MYIKEVKVENFKVFKDLHIKLDNFNVFIGANAAGKSNLVDIFGFIRSVAVSGLANAISLQGGLEYLTNISIGRDKPISIEIKSDNFLPAEITQDKDGSVIKRSVSEITYKFIFQIEKDSLESDFNILKDELNIKFDFFSQKDKQESKKIHKAILNIINQNGSLDITVNDESNDENLKLEPEKIIPEIFLKNGLPKNSLLLESHLLYNIDPQLEKLFKGIAIYNINPTLSKQMVSINGKSELEEDGHNLALVLRNILQHPEKERKFNNLIKDILPFVKQFDVEKFADKSLLFKLKETFNDEEFLPASLRSDGTINITALIIALYFEQKKIAVIEETERNIHPYLIPKITEMLIDAAVNKQIIVTTHNPEIVKYINLSDLYLVHRNNEGFSKINRPIDKKEVQIFLSNDMGIDELYVQNLLEV